MISALESLTPVLTRRPSQNLTSPKVQGTLFEKALAGLEPSAPHAPALKGSLESRFSELIRFQAVTAERCLRIELLARVADSALTTVRKLQTTA